MFDVGFSELLIIAVVALLVLGPERLPKAARMAGAFARRARNQWEAVKAELERELEAERVKADIDAAVGAAASPVREFEESMRQLERDAGVGDARDPGASDARDDAGPRP